MPEPRPANQIAEDRHFLVNMGFKNVDEQIVFAGKIRVEGALGMPAALQMFRIDIVATPSSTIEAWAAAISRFRVWR
jgi:hypothetical protein